SPIPVSSTLTTSAPKSARSSEQNPPGSRRERSRTFSPSSGRLMRPHAEKLARLGDRRRTSPEILGQLPRLGDQLAVGARHAAVREVEVVLEAHPYRP